MGKSNGETDLSLLFLVSVEVSNIGVSIYVLIYPTVRVSRGENPILRNVNNGTLRIIKVKN